MSEKPARSEWEEASVYRGILEDLRSERPLAPEVRNILANELEDKWFPPPDTKARQRLQERATLALAYIYLIDAKYREIEEGRTAPRGGALDAAKEAVAETFGINVEALHKRITRGKAAAIQLGTSINATRELERENALQLEREYARDVFEDVSEKGQI